MAATSFRRGKIENYVQKLRERKVILKNQLEQDEFKGLEQHLKGQIAAVDTIIQELAYEFDLDIQERSDRP